MQYKNYVSYNCAVEICTSLLTNVTPINIIIKELFKEIIQPELKQFTPNTTLG